MLFITLGAGVFIGFFVALVVIGLCHAAAKAERAGEFQRECCPNCDLLPVPVREATHTR